MSLFEKIADTEFVGKEVTIRARVCGIVDYGREVQFELESGLFFYLPREEAEKVIRDE